jgi:hypothetical protein
MPPELSKRKQIILAVFFLILMIANPATAKIINRFSIALGSNWAGLSLRPVGSDFFYDQATEIFVPCCEGKYNMKITNGPGIDAVISFSMTDRFLFDAGAIYLFPKRLNLMPGREHNFLDDYLHLSYSESKYYTKFRLTAPILGVSYKYPLYNWTIRLSGSIAFLFGQAQYLAKFHYDGPPEHTYEQIDSFTADGMGYIFSIGTSVRLTKILFINPNFGYRIMETGELKNKAGAKWDGMKLDFSGPFVGALVGFGIE